MKKENDTLLSDLTRKLEKLPLEKLALLEVALEEINEPKVREIKSFDEWASPGIKQTVIKGTTGDLLTFKWQPLTVEDKIAIDKLCEPPIPTSINPTWKSLPTDPITGKILPGMEIPDYNNSDYIGIQGFCA